MRLINTATLKIHEFLSEDKIEPYAILSHTWGNEECTLQQMEHPDVSLVTKRAGYDKIFLCCKQARNDGLDWAWVDTCCIDKTSTAELSEAINSMFRWYRKAAICYAYLSDVRYIVDLDKSRWFKRGWTLQELVAPNTMRFYNSDWKDLGTKLELQEILQQLTGIEAEVLATDQIGAVLHTVSIAKRMSWAAKRQTTRIEDRAYSLLGIFDVNMPLLYGEGRRSYERLQEAIFRVSNDQSLFAWGLPDYVRTMSDFVETYIPTDNTKTLGMFAKSPSDFIFTDGIYTLEDDQTTFPPIVSNAGVRIELMKVAKRSSRVALEFVVINCTLKGRFDHYLGFPILPWGKMWHARCNELVLIAVTDLVEPDSDYPFRKPSVLLIKAPTTTRKHESPTKSIKLVQIANDYKHCYVLDDVRCSAHAEYSPDDQILTLSEHKNDLHAVLFFRPALSDPLKFLLQTFRKPKAMVAKTLEKTWLNGSFIVKAREPSYGNDDYSLTFPPFAILVGGFESKLWIESVLLLNDDEQRKTADDYAMLLSIHEGFIRSCATKNKLLSLLERNTPVEPLCGRWFKHECLLIMHWHYNHRKPIGNLKLQVKREQLRLWLDTELLIVPANLVEHSLT